MAKAPQHILEIQYANPDPPSDSDWATSVAGGTFPKPADREWTQVLAPKEDYDQFTLVGASGWVLDPKVSDKDLPFTHPFGFDWEFALALDNPYAPLLARGNQKPEDGSIIDDAGRLEIPVPAGGLLGVEWDGGLVPSVFQQQVNEGDRVAVFGRWIVDCGHPIPLDDGTKSFRSEIHPPLLMACARVDPNNTGAQVTRAIFTSRPYLVGQTYTVDTSKIYDDAAEDDGPLYSHLTKEVLKVNAHVLSRQVEAHPKIKAHPFLGAQLLHFVVRSPVQSAPGRLGIVSPLSGRLAVSFQFTVRSGCGVQVTSSGPNSVDVLVAMSHAGYTSPPLPTRNEHNWTELELRDLDPDNAKIYLDTGKLSEDAQEIAGLILGGIPGYVLGAIGAADVAHVLGKGIKSDVYDCASLSNTNILDSSHAVSAFADNIPAGQGVLQDDNQPYPVFGWLEVRFEPPAVHR